MNNKTVFSIKIGGQAGQGIKSAGLMLSKVASRSGYHIYNYFEYPSLIRGGHNVMQINFSGEEVTGPFQKTDFLIALNMETITKHLAELKEGSGILYDDRHDLKTLNISQSINLYPLPLSKLASGQELLINTVALGASLALLKGELSILKDLISKEFAHKSGEIIASNLQAAQAGFDYIKKNFVDHIKEVLSPLAGKKPSLVLNGNEAVALGAISAGLQFAAIYPMSPISNILHVLAAHQEEYGYIYKQPEDEIAAVNMAIGASFAGARAMVATSGGGFSLMTEGLGLAAMTETPLVVVEGMRPGPATGLPTWSGQGDLQFILHAHQGDFPRIVLAAGDVKEAYEMTLRAFYLAEKYQTPVILLIDKNICEHEQSLLLFSIPNLPEKSKRAFPGSGNFFITNSYEHDTNGFSTEEINQINTQMKKRMAKLENCANIDMPNPQLFGLPKADLTIVSWGSNKGSILQAINNYNNVNFLHLTWMSPFPTEAVRNILAEANYILDIECNYSGQLASLIREKTGIDIPDKMLKYDGRPIFPEEIVQRINSILKK